jgi:hypothetical protein
MNWKNVLYLLRVERKSGRLIRGIKTTRYRENRFLAYWPYWTAAIIGILMGLLSNYIAELIYSDPTFIAEGLPPLTEGAVSLFVSMPTLILVLSLVFTMFQQIQLAGLKKSSQVMYWLPVTWQEHTLASILANLFGLPIALVIGFSAGLIVFSALNGLVLLAAALLTALAMCGAAFMGSATTEIARIIQVRFTGAVYKSSGRAAVWVRLIGSLLFFLVLYIVYFSIFTGDASITFIQSIASVQNTVWFIPYVWIGITLYYLLVSSEFLLGAVFVVASLLFLVGLYYLAVLLNQRFGLYEPPAIKVQTSGVYAPKAGFLGKLGFSTVESAVLQKDIRSFTRRRELIGVFIVPIVFTIVPIFNSLNGVNQGAPPELKLMFEAMIFLLPGGIMAMTLGNMLIGEEGQAAWRIYASPISPKNLVKSKFAFLVLFSAIIVLITSAVGIVFFMPSIRVIVMAVLESLFIVFAVGSIGLTCGFKGADFSSSRRQRMIRQEWALISLLGSALGALAILAPVALPYLLSLFLGFGSMGLVETAVYLTISGVIAAIITFIFYRINVGQAAELIRNAEI